VAAIPGYPRLPSGGRESGEVRVEITISPEGDVLSAKAISGPERLRAVSEAAARQWRFRSQEKVIEKWPITFAFILRRGLSDPPTVASVFKGPNRLEVFAEDRQIVTIADPQVEDIEKSRKKK
jgi:TonB family protein